MGTLILAAFVWSAVELYDRRKEYYEQKAQAEQMYCRDDNEKVTCWVIEEK